MKPDRKQITQWRRHLLEEVDAAYLYERLAEMEPDKKRGDIYRKLKNVEERHIAMWTDILAEHDAPTPRPNPSLRARALAGIAKRVGHEALLRMLLREEGVEVKRYLALHRTSETGVATDAALRLAKESAEHALTLQALSGAPDEAWHSIASGGLLRNIVYGFNDGLTANFGLVAGVIGADAHAGFVIISGLSGAVADALSMGSSGYLAAKSEREVYEHEIAMEREEIRIMPELETEELTLIYEAKGMDPEHAKALAKEVMSKPEQALEEMVREELRIGADYSSPMREALVTGAATIFGALIPVFPFLFMPLRAAAIASFIISMLAHFAVGAARSFFTGRGIFRSGMDMFLVGLGVAFAGYVAGDLIIRLMPQ